MASRLWRRGIATCMAVVAVAAFVATASAQQEVVTGGGNFNGGKPKAAPNSPNGKGLGKPAGAGNKGGASQERGRKATKVVSFSINLECVETAGDVLNVITVDFRVSDDLAANYPVIVAGAATFVVAPTFTKGDWTCTGTVAGGDLGASSNSPIEGVITFSDSSTLAGRITFTFQDLGEPGKGTDEARILIESLNELAEVGCTTSRATFVDIAAGTKIDGGNIQGEIQPEP